LAVGILGGGFEVKEIKVSNVTTSVRIIAGLIGIVFVGLGFWQPRAPDRASAGGRTRRGRAVMMSEREHDTDRFGGDYRGFDVNAGHIELCEDACKNDTKCLAWTYVKPGIQTQMARCWLKGVVPASANNICCVSGTKTRS
jgi:PAN domain